MSLFELNPISVFISQWTSLPYPTTDFTNKTVIVTGANIGLGLEAARHFTRLNATKVILGCRSLENGQAAKDSIEASTPGRAGAVEVWQLDLGSFESVKQFCDRATSTLDRLDAVVENAGFATREFHQREGYEEQVTINVISTFLVAISLLPALRRMAAKHNVVPHLTIVSSDAHVFTGFSAKTADRIFEELRGPTNMDYRYSDTKLLQVLLAQQLAKALEASAKGAQQVVVNTLSPGLCRSNLYRHAKWPHTWILPISLFILARTSEMGSRTLVHAAAAGESTHGKYLVDCRIHPESSFARSEEGAKVRSRAWDELLDILEGIHPGIRELI